MALDSKKCPTVEELGGGQLELVKSATGMFDSIGSLDDNGLLAYKPASWTGLDANTQWGAGAVTIPGVIRSSGNNLYHYRHDTKQKYLIYDTSNFSPSSYLPLAGGTMTGSISYRTANYTSTPLRVYDDGTTYGHTLVLEAGGTVYIGAGESASSLRDALNTNGTESMYLAADESIAVFTNVQNPSERKLVATFKNNGYMGIGTDSPSHFLDIQKSGETYVRSYTSSATGYDVGFIAENPNYSIRFQIGNGGVNRGIYDNANSSWMMYRDATTDIIFPKGSLKVTGSTDGRWCEVAPGGFRNHSISGSSGWAMGLEFWNNDGTSHLGNAAGAFGNGNGNLQHYFYGGAWNDAGLYILNSNKNVGIGTTTPTTKLHIMQSAWDNGITLQRTVAGGGTAIRCLNNTGAELGNFGLTGMKKFEINFAGVSDIFTIDSAVNVFANAYYEWSDERLKNIKQEVDVNLDDIAKLPKVYYTLKDDEKAESKIGTIAQEVQKIYPELVKEDDKGYLSVQYDKLSIIALAAVDELNSQNKKMQSEIDNLKDELKLIKEKLGL